MIAQVRLFCKKGDAPHVLFQCLAHKCPNLLQNSLFSAVQTVVSRLGKMQIMSRTLNVSYNELLAQDL